MGLELPLVSAAMARMRDPVTSLAAYGGVVFPIALLIESPIVMMLTASTALSRDLQAYRLQRAFAVWTALGLTLLHVLVAFTPLFDVVVGGIMHAPAIIHEPSRRGLQIMLPWTLSIAYRRFQQGAMIRFGQTRVVGVGTVVRLLALTTTLGVGSLTQLPGIVVGTLAVTTSVMCEAIYAGIMVRPIVRGALRRAPAAAEPLTLSKFLHFYLPLAATPMLMFLAMPLCSAAMGRMPRTIESLAVWPVVNGFVFTLRSTGFGLNEVVVALLDHRGALPALRRFTLMLAIVVSAVLLVVAATPLGLVWFARVSALPAALVAMASIALWLAAPVPALTAFQSLYQGTVVHRRRTRAITESVTVYLAGIVLVLGVGIALRWVGLYAAVIALTVGNAAQVIVLESRARSVWREHDAPVREAVVPLASEPGA